MSYPFFNEVLKELGYRLNYEAVINYAGNPYAEKAGEWIMDNNPMMVESGNASGNRSLEKFLGGAKIGHVKSSKGTAMPKWARGSLNKNGKENQSKPTE